MKSDKLKYDLRNRGLSYPEFSRAMDVSLNSVKSWACGRRHMSQKNIDKAKRLFSLLLKVDRLKVADQKNIRHALLGGHISLSEAEHMLWFEKGV